MQSVATDNTAMLKQQMETLGEQARDAALYLSTASTEIKNKALQEAANAIRHHQDEILVANAKDVKAAKDKKIDGALLDRLALNHERIEAMAKGLEDIIALNDPVGRVLDAWDRPNGLNISRVAVPLGVIGIIYESRPNVTADAGALCLKSGNAVILRGGSESFHSSNAIMDCLQQGLKAAGIPETAIQLVPTRDREAVGIMLRMPELIDVIVPRGGKGLVARIVEESRVPTLQHLDGNCHSYIHEDADKDMACSVIHNAKMRRTGICGATESIVIDAKATTSILPSLVDILEEEACEVRGDKRARSIDSRIKAAKEEDWETEYLDSIVSVKVVDNLDEAIDHISTYSSHHTDAIITNNAEAAATFLNRIDSAIVMHNASTQFADGGEFGMGAEIGIATGKLHARGPVGLEQLTTFKYVVRGNGQTRP